MRAFGPLSRPQSVCETNINSLLLGRNPAEVFGQCEELSIPRGQLARTDAFSGRSRSRPRISLLKLLEELARRAAKPEHGGDVSRVTTSTRLIAVDIPNNAGIRNNDWRSYRTSVDQIESWTGYNFFSAVPASIQSVIEAKVDNQ